MPDQLAAAISRTIAGTNATDARRAAERHQVGPDTIGQRAHQLVRAVVLLVLVRYVPGSGRWLLWFLVRWCCWFVLLVWLTGLGGWAW